MTPAQIQARKAERAQQAPTPDFASRLFVTIAQQPTAKLFAYAATLPEAAQIALLRVAVLARDEQLEYALSGDPLVLKDL